MYNLLQEPDRYNWLASVYLSADFVNLLFVTSLDFLSRKIALVWHSDVDIRYSFTVNFKQDSPAIDSQTL